MGAGIGGLAAGRALREAGFEVRILERAERLEPLGAGISLWPNAVRALREIGIGIAAVGRRPDPDVGIRRMDGSMLAPTDPGAIEARFGDPIVVLHRGTLQRELLSGGMSDLVETGVEVVAASSGGDGASVRTRAGEERHADLVVAADGLRSTIRGDLLADGPPRHSGLLTYRGIAEQRTPIRSGEYWGSGGVFGMVQIDGGRVYWFATRRSGGADPPEENPIPSLLRRFDGCAQEICETIAATPPAAVLRHELWDRPPASEWCRGSLALLGDAAHPMLPFLGQGACQALEDAVAMRAELASREDVPGALRAYVARRRRRAARIVRLSRRFGRLSHLRNPAARAVRDALLAATPRPLRLRQLDPVVGRPRSRAGVGGHT